MKVGKKSFGWFVVMLVCAAAFGQTHLLPVAVSDSTSVIQPYIDTINVTANDSSPSADSFCIKKVYGSSFFTVSGCNNIIFKSDSSAFGNDTAMYVICNVGEPNLCDTGMVVVTVEIHYTPLMLNNSRWITYLETDCDGGGFDQWTYYWTTVDTLINSKWYKAIYTNSVRQSIYCSLGQPGPPTTLPTYYAGFLRQDTMAYKVYLLMPDSINEHLLYDFDLALGDKVYFQQDSLVVNNIYYINNGQSDYRQIDFGPIASNFSQEFAEGTWIEGIGSTAGLVNPFRSLYSPHLLCFSSNGQTIYPNYASDTCAYLPLGTETILTIQTSIHPNPTTGLCTLQLSATGESLSASIFDITGREVHPLFTNKTGATFNFNVSVLADGVYFVKISGNNGQVGIVKLVKE